MRAPVPELLTAKELASAIHVGRGWVCAAVQAGAPRVTKRLYDHAEFIRWMRANPDFTRAEVYAGAKKRKRRGHRRAGTVSF